MNKALIKPLIGICKTTNGLITLLPVITPNIIRSNTRKDKIYMRQLICFLFIALHIFVAGQTDIGDKIIAFSIKNLNKKIDRGECWDLASAALTNANADWSPPFNFGTKIDISQAQRADILQFTNIKMKFTNGSISFPQHTAIIYKRNKSQITLIHQNFNNKRYVDTLTISLDNIKKGKIYAFRPKAK